MIIDCIRNNYQQGKRKKKDINIAKNKLRINKLLLDEKTWYKKVQASQYLYPKKQ